MRRLILAALFMLAAGGVARAACPAVLTDCPNMNANTGSFGGTITGSSTPTGSTSSSTLADLFGRQYYCPLSVGLAACVTDAPGGSTIMLAPNVTYTVSTNINVTKFNTTIACPGWNTVIKRGTALTGTMLQFSGVGGTLRDCAVDGSAPTNSTNTGADLTVSGAGGGLFHNSVINSRGNSIGLSGANSWARDNKIVGIANATLQTYGIWAINHVPVIIEGNSVTSAGIDAIGFDGDGSVVAGNYVGNSHCYTGIGGGQIASYGGNGAVIVNNTVQTGCGIVAGGIEVNSLHTVVSGNTVTNSQFFGIALDAAADNILVSGNTVLNPGTGTVANGFVVATNVSNFRVVGNAFTDNRGGSAKMTYGINVLAGTSNNYEIVGNHVSGATTANLFDGGTGTAKLIADNLGVDNVIPAVASAATLPVPVNPTFSLTGTTGVTAMSGVVWPGRTVNIIPTGVLTFTAGATIANTVTTVANVPVVGVYNGTAWNLK